MRTRVVKQLQRALADGRSALWNQGYRFGYDFGKKRGYDKGWTHGVRYEMLRQDYMRQHPGETDLPLEERQRVLSAQYAEAFPKRGKPC